MKFEEGSIIEVDGKEGVVLEIDCKDNKEFAIVSFDGENKKTDVDVFEIVKKDNETFFKDVKNQDFKADLLSALAIQVFEDMNK